MRLEEQTEGENRPIKKTYNINCEEIKANKLKQRYNWTKLNGTGKKRHEN